VSILGVGGSRPPDLGQGVVLARKGSQRVVKNIISYHVQEVCSKVVNFEDK